MRIAVTGSIATDHLMTYPGRFSESLVAVISQSGNRTSFDIIPRQASAVFAGTGFGSMKISLKSGNNLR